MHYRIKEVWTTEDVIKKEVEGVGGWEYQEIYWDLIITDRFEVLELKSLGSQVSGGG